MQFIRFHTKYAKKGGNYDMSFLDELIFQVHNDNGLWLIVFYVVFATFLISLTKFCEKPAKEGSS